MASTGDSMLDIYFTDRSRETISIRLWKSSAENFSEEPFCPVVIRKAAVREFHGYKSLNEGPDTLIWVQLINLNII
jgi:hypothetical protein